MLSAKSTGNIDAFVNRAQQQTQKVINHDMPFILMENIKRHQPERLAKTSSNESGSSKMTTSPKTTTAQQESGAPYNDADKGAADYSTNSSTRCFGCFEAFFRRLSGGH